jgi:hypothetical protein
MELQFSYLTKMGKGFAYYTAVKTIEKHIENPDPGSEFAGVVGKMEQMTPEQKINTLVSKGFDALLAFYAGTIAGFIGLRRDDPAKTTHIFRVRTNDEYQKNGVAVESLARVVQDAFAAGHGLVQAGKGKDPLMTAVLESFREKYSGIYNVSPETGRIEDKK